MFSCKWSHNFVMGAQRGHPGEQPNVEQQQHRWHYLRTPTEIVYLPLPFPATAFAPPPSPAATPPLLLLFIRQRKAGTVTTSWNNAPSVLCHNIYIPPCSLTALRHCAVLPAAASASHYGNRIADLPNVCAIICHPFLAPAFLRLFTQFPPLPHTLPNYWKFFEGT